MNPTEKRFREMIENDEEYYNKRIEAYAHLSLKQQAIATWLLESGLETEVFIAVKTLQEQHGGNDDAYVTAFAAIMSAISMFLEEM